MKTLVAIAATIVLFAGIAEASDVWTDADTYRQLAITALLAVDCGQTLNTSNPRPPNVYDGGNVWTAGTVYRESNPLLGPHPRREVVMGYFAGSALLSFATAYVLPERWRAAYQYVYIGFEGGVVLHNYTAGIQVRF